MVINCWYFRNIGSGGSVQVNRQVACVLGKKHGVVMKAWKDSQDS